MSFCFRRVKKGANFQTSFCAVKSSIDYCARENVRVSVKCLVCYTAVFSVVTQCSWGGALRDDTKNGCVADYKIFFGSKACRMMLLLDKLTTLSVGNPRDFDKEMIILYFSLLQT